MQKELTIPFLPANLVKQFWRVDDSRADATRSSIRTEPNITYRNREAVLEYFRTHPGIGGYLWAEAWPNLVRYFGPDVKVVLEVLYYPGEMTEPVLVGWIQCYVDVDTGMQRLDAFQEHWLLDNLPDPKYHFNFNLEFR